MAKLVETDELIQYLDADESDATVIAALRDAVESLLCEATGREFSPPVDVVDEIHNGTGTKYLYTNKPVALLVGLRVTEGTDSASELVIDVSNDVIFERGKRKLTGRFTRFPRGHANIMVSYESEDDRPEIARQAVREVVAMMFRARGTEGARSEQTGPLRQVMKRSIDESLSWKIAVDLLHRPLLPT